MQLLVATETVELLQVRSPGRSPYGDTYWKWSDVARRRSRTEKGRGCGFLLPLEQPVEGGKGGDIETCKRALVSEAPHEILLIRWYL